MKTGLSAAYNGFAVNDIYLIDGHDNRMSSNKINLGLLVKIIGSGVENYKLVNVKIDPGCTIFQSLS